MRGGDFIAEEHKKSFMLYFDTFSSVSALPAEQRGELLLLLYRYAMAADAAPTEPEDILKQYPVLNGEGQMAYRFLAESIRRDTEKWKAKQRRYQAAAARRLEGAPPSPRAGRRRERTGEDGEDLDWVKPYLDGLRRENG